MDRDKQHADVPVVRGSTVVADRVTGLAHVVRGWLPIPVDMGHGNVGEEDIPVAACGAHLSVVDLVDMIMAPLAHATCLFCMRRWACGPR